MGIKMFYIAGPTYKHTFHMPASIEIAGASRSPLRSGTRTLEPIWAVGYVHPNLVPLDMPSMIRYSRTGNAGVKESLDMRESIRYLYKIRTLATPEKVFEFTAELSPTHSMCGDIPLWLRLGEEQCICCPLDPKTHPVCPAAHVLADLIESVGGMLSYERVELIVETPERSYHAETSIQRALSSLIGLRMATSGCPILAMFKPMARFHLPLSTVEETVYRSVGSYLVEQYFRAQRGEPVDISLATLRRRYDHVHDVNVGLTDRIRRLTDGDATINAMVLLDLFAQDLPYSIDNRLDDLRQWFSIL